MQKTYSTVQGDMWDKIAYNQLGSVAHTDKLMRSNIRYLSYCVFPAGIVLTLPEIQQSKHDESNLPPWKKVLPDE